MEIKKVDSREFAKRYSKKRSPLNEAVRNLGLGEVLRVSGAGINTTRTTAYLAAKAAGFKVATGTDGEDILIKRIK